MNKQRYIKLKCVISDASHSLEHAEFRDPISAMVGEGETVISKI